MDTPFVNNRYNILKGLESRGGRSVCQVEDLCTGEILALKRLLDQSPEQRRDFEREFLLLRELEHLFFPKAHDFGVEPGGEPFFTMEYVSGKDMSTFLREAGSFDIAPALLYSVCLALRNLHHRGFLHGDVKPENIIVEDEYEGRLHPAIKVLDLGLSRKFFQGEGSQFSGTVNYLAPEMALGDMVDQRADIYALGLSFYEGLTGKQPFGGRKVDAVKRILSGDIPPIQDVMADVPSFLAELIGSMVAVRPADRPSNVEEIIGRLEESGSVNGSSWKEILFVSPPFVRGEEILDEFLAGGEKRPDENESRIHFVVGADGSGKTSLMNRLKSRLQVEGCAALWMNVDAERTPLGAFKRLARVAAPERYCDEVEGDRLDRLDFEGVDQVIVSLVDALRGRRIALFIDDVERIDTASLIAVKLLLAGLAGGSVRCFLALNEEGAAGPDMDGSPPVRGLNTFLEGIESVVRYRRTIGLSGLSPREAGELIRGSLGDVPQGIDDLVDEMEKLTDRNPGRIRRLLSILLTGGVLQFSKGRWLVEVKGLKGVRLPEESGLESRGKTASPDEGEKGISRLKTAVTKSREEGHLLDALERLRGLKNRVQGDREEEFWVAEETGKTLFDLRSYPEAVEEYRKAIAVAGDDDSLMERALEVRVQLSRALIKVSALDEAHEILKSTGDGLGWKNDHPLIGRIQREIGWIHFQRSRYKSALRFYRKSLTSSRHSRDIPNLLHLYNDIAVLHLWVSDWRKADWWAGKAVREGRKEGRPTVVANARNIQGQGLKKRGKYPDAERRYHQALDIFREMRDFFGMSQIFNSLGELHRERGKLEQAIPYLEKGLYLKEFLHNEIGMAISLSNLGLAYRETGKLDRAREYFSRSIDIRLRTGDRDGAGEVHGYLAETLIDLELWDEARVILSRQRVILKKSESPYHRHGNRYLEGLIDLRTGSFERAAERLSKVARGFEKLNFPEEATRARVDFSLSLLELGRIEEAEGEALRARDTARSLEHQRLIIESHLAVARILERKGEEDEASLHYRESQRQLKDTPVKTLRARVLLACAEHLFRKGAWRERGRDASEFDGCLTEAEGLFAEMGIEGGLKAARSLRERTERGVREIGGRELFTLYKAGGIINSSLDTDVILNQLMDLIVQTLDAERGVIFIRDPVTGELVMEVARNVEKETIDDAMSFSSTILHDVEKRGSPIFIPDCREDELCLGSKSISRYSILSIICVPLRLKGEIVGTIYIDDRRTSHLFHPGDVDFLMSLGDMAALAIQNARLYRDLDVAKRRLEAENLDLRRLARGRSEFHGMIGRHEKMEVLYQVVEKVSQTDATVLIRGENGSGKELVARAVHYLSKRRDGPFIVVNCAAIPEALLESEIFGIEKGTATGVDRRVGKFEQAHGGTIFMDEIGDMSPAVQAKLLRVLQEKRFQRLGGKENIAVDVKIVSATNKDLEKAIQAGSFREDLYYRLNALPVFVPALRERVEDMPLLVDFFLRRWSEENDRDLPTVSRGVMKVLSGYPWPGNVRQLKNVIERMALMCSGGVMEEKDLPPDLLIPVAGDGSGPEREMKKLREIQIDYVRSVYRRCGGNKRKACETLGITYKTLQTYLSQILE